MRELSVLCVTNRRLCQGDFLSQIERIAQGRPKAILLREKDLPEEDYRRLAIQCLEKCRCYQVELIVHSHLQIARDLCISKIHLPFQRFLEEQGNFGGLQVEVSIHSREEARRVQEMGAHSVIAGHIYPTNCKPGLPPRGTTFLKEIVQSISIPVYAIGGITPEHAGEIAETGAAGVCLMSSLMAAQDPKKILREYRGEKG